MKEDHEQPPSSEDHSAKRLRVSFHIRSAVPRHCEAPQVAFGHEDDSDHETASFSQRTVVVADIASVSSSRPTEQRNENQSGESAVDTIVSCPPTTSSVDFERFRGSLTARSSPFFRRYTALVGGERGISGAADSGLVALGLARLSCVVDAMVQLADFRVLSLPKSALSQNTAGRTSGSDLVNAACELFEALCECVVEVSQSQKEISAEVYIDALRCHWRSGSGSAVVESERISAAAGGMEQIAARAAALFRMKDTVASMYAWSLLTKNVAAELVRAVSAEVPGAPDYACEHHRCFVRIIDPIAGSGIHAAIFKQAGACVVLADSVGGGSTQKSEVDMHRIAQLSRPLQGVDDSASVTFKASVDLTSPANMYREPASRVIWEEAERRCVFDVSAEACAWWQRHSSTREKSGSDDRCASADATEDVLLLSFPPPPPSTVAETCLQRFRGNWIAFIGEWRGCTGTSDFFDLLERDWDVHCKLEIPRWPMMEDRAYLFRRRTH